MMDTTVPVRPWPPQPACKKDGWQGGGHNGQMEREIKESAKERVKQSDEREESVEKN